MLFGHADRRTFVFITNDLLTTLVEVNVEKYHLFNARHIEHPLQVEIYLVTPALELFHFKLTHF